MEAAAPVTPPPRLAPAAALGLSLHAVDRADLQKTWASGRIEDVRKKLVDALAGLRAAEGVSYHNTSYSFGRCYDNER